jgi:hypothetical protein
MFERLKFAMLMVFHTAFKISIKKKGMSYLEFELRQKTCWSFKSKVQQVMQSSLNYPLTGVIHVDEFMVGGPEEDKRGRSKGLNESISCPYFILRVALVALLAVGVAVFIN